MRTTREICGTMICLALLVAGCSKPAPTEQAPPAAPAARPEAAAQVPAPAAATEATTAGTAPPAGEAAPAAAAATEAAKEAAAPAAVAASPATTATQATAPAAPVAAPEPVAKAPTAATPAPAAAPAPVAAPAPAAPPAAAPAAAPALADPGGVIAVASTKPGLKYVGSDVCGDCHDVQFASWSSTAHATRTPPLDCEGCHGPGSEYKAMSVMKDPAKAKAAGLVMPDKAFCGNCHKKGVDDAFLRKAHAHEE